MPKNKNNQESVFNIKDRLEEFGETFREKASRIAYDDDNSPKMERKRKNTNSNRPSQKHNNIDF